MVTESVPPRRQRILSAALLRFMLSLRAGIQKGKHAGGWIPRDKELVQKEAKIRRRIVRASRRANRGS
jgi:hypothetical protein